MSAQKPTLPDIKTDFSAWYHDVVFQAELADQAPVKGCMVIRPYGYALWEEIQKILDKKIKDTGHQNAAFPLLIPQSFLQKEAKHVAGFSPELAVVTHAGGKELEEPLVVRPTSETIIHYMFAQWLRSWRDLPIKINQWASVVRWEMRTRPFLRTTEFWWQEGHTAHETHAEAEAEAKMMLSEYVDLIENYLAIPVVAAKKSESERFAGADATYTMEGLMQDGKALQMGTSHIISQTFAHAFNMSFQDRDGKVAYPHLTSWAVTTRLIGGLIMTHGDQKGLVLPPKVAPIQIVIVPIIMKEETRAQVLEKAREVEQILKNSNYRTHCDADDQLTPGAKYYKWELRGVPLRIELGPRDIANGVAMVVDRLGMCKEPVKLEEIARYCAQKLEDIQGHMFKLAKERRDAQWHRVARLIDFHEKLETQGGFYQTGWCGQASCEQEIKNCKATIRCVLEEKSFDGCCFCGKPSPADVLVAKAY